MTSRRAFLAGAGALAVSPLLPAMPAAGEGRMVGAAYVSQFGTITSVSGRVYWLDAVGFKVWDAWMSGENTIGETQKTQAT